MRFIYDIFVVVPSSLAIQAAINLFLKQPLDEEATLPVDSCWQKRYHSSHRQVPPPFFENDLRREF